MRLLEAGTHGSRDWFYEANGFAGNTSFIGVDWTYWFWFPDSDVVHPQSFNNIRNNVEDIIYFAQNYEIALQTLRSSRVTFSSYKFCIYKNTDLDRYEIVYETSPTTYNTAKWSMIWEVFNTFGITDLDFYDGAGYSINDGSEPNFGSIPCFNTLQEAVNWLHSDQPVINPDEDPGTLGPDSPNTPIENNNDWDDIANTFLSSLTVVAEIDQTNLNLIGEALNNQIDLSDNLGQNLLKIARGIIQSNIKDGIISIKSIPIPKNQSLPYSNGQWETLFTPLGGSPVSGKKLNNTIKRYSLGSMNINPMFDDYKSFMCEYSIYLPFSGIHKLDSDIIVGNKLILSVDIDFLMGSLLYHIGINDGITYREIYQFTGDAGVELPITTQDYSSKYQSLMNGVFSGIGMTAGAIAGPGGMVGGMMAASAIGTGLKTAGNVSSVPGNYIQTGKLVPNASIISILNVYLIVTSPQDKTPNIAHTKGLPCHKTGTLSGFNGFTIVTQCDLSGVPYATDEDKKEIRSLLANGVYL